MNYNEVYQLNSAEKRWLKTEYAVEATSYEELAIWRETHEQIKWEQCNGWIVTVGEVNIKRVGGGMTERLPVSVSLTWQLLDGHLVCFYEATSQVVDHRMVENYIRAHCDKRTNAMNFFHCTSDLGIKFTPKR